MLPNEPQTPDEKNRTTGQGSEMVAGQKPAPTLADDQIVTEHKLPRRSFLATAATILAGGALAMAAAKRARAQDTDPDSQKRTDPDQKKKRTDPDAKKGKKKKKSKKSTKKTKDTDPDQY